jgi:hypothetical protein
MVWVFASILKVKGSNLTNGVFMVNSGKMIEYLLCSSLENVVNQVDYMAYVLRLSFKPSRGSDTCQ